MKAAPFTYHRPATIDHALDLLADLAPQGGRILAGGQSLVPIMAFRLSEPAHLIDINRVADFTTLRVANNRLHIPATARHAGFTRDVASPPLGPLLAQVASHIAHLPIRVRGTFCGSLAHADPAAEWPLVFVTLDGEALASSRSGTRLISAADFFQGIMTTALAPDELLAEARLPLPSATTRLGFAEVSRRAGDYAMAMALVSFEIISGAIRNPRIGLGGAEPIPRRIPEVEAALIGAPAEPAAFNCAADAAADAITPMEDLQVSTGLRRDLVRAVVGRALHEAAA